MTNLPDNPIPGRTNSPVVPPPPPIQDGVANPGRTGEPIPRVPVQDGGDGLVHNVGEPTAPGPAIPGITGDQQLTSDNSSGSTITERFQAAGSWSLSLRTDTPPEILRKLAVLGHIVITPTQFDPAAQGDAATLSIARYTGVLLAKTDEFTPNGQGLAWWLGSDTHGGLALGSFPTVFTTSTLSAALTTLLTTGSTASGCAIGSISNTGLSSVTASLSWMSMFSAVTTVCALAGAEFRINPNATIDAALQATVFPTATTPKVIVTDLDGSIEDPTLIGLHVTSMPVGVDVKQYATEVVALGQAGDGSVAPIGDAVRGSVPYLNLLGPSAFGGAAPNIGLVKLVNSPSIGAVAIGAAATATLNLATVRTSISSLSIDARDIRSVLAAGDFIWAYRPVSGLVDLAQQVSYQGNNISPVKLRVQAVTWPIDAQHGVFYRDLNGVYTDLTPYVNLDEPGATLDVGTGPADATADTTAFTQSDPDIVARLTSYPAKLDWQPFLFGSTTNPSMGTSPQRIGIYHIINSMVEVTELTIVLGTGVAGGGAGTYIISIPVPTSQTFSAVLGSGVITDGAGTLRNCSIRVWDSTHVFFHAEGGLVGPTTPFTITNGSEFRASFKYEAA